MPAVAALSRSALPGRLGAFVHALDALMESGQDDAAVLACAAPLVGDLVGHDDWLPSAFAEPDPRTYRQYLLYCDERERFSVVSFVWSPGQSTPIHDHGVWGVVGVMRGIEISQGYSRADEGTLAPAGPPSMLEPGDVEILSPAAGDIHRVTSGSERDVTVSIHVYGGNIGRITRRSFDESGVSRPFVSRYSNDPTPEPSN